MDTSTLWILLYISTVVMCISLILFITVELKGFINVGDLAITVMAGIIPVVNFICLFIVLIKLADKLNFMNIVVYTKKKGE